MDSSETFLKEPAIHIFDPMFPLRVAIFLIFSAASAHAVVRLPSLEEADTLDLDTREAHEFFVARQAGSDLNDAGYYLSLAAVPAIYFAFMDPDEVGFSSDEAAFMAGAYGLLPVLSATMAAGNMVYAKAARYHRQRDYGITYSLLPFFACAAAAAKLAVWAVRYDDPSVTPALAILGFTELFFVPALRIQFSNAEGWLEQVRVRVVPAPQGLSMRLDF